MPGCLCLAAVLRRSDHPAQRTFPGHLPRSPHTGAPIQGGIGWYDNSLWCRLLHPYLLPVRERRKWPHDGCAPTPPCHHRRHGEPCLGSLLHFIKLYKAIDLIAGVVLAADGGLLMVYLDPSLTAGTIYGLTIIIAVGTGLSMVTSYTVATLTLKPGDTGAGLRIQNISQIGGQVIVLARCRGKDQPVDVHQEAVGRPSPPQLLRPRDSGRGGRRTECPI